MLKKISMLMVAVLLVVSLGACGGSSNAIRPDETPIPVPTDFIPPTATVIDGEAISVDDKQTDTISKAFYTVVMSLEELQDYYKNLPEDFGVVKLVEKDKKQLEEFIGAPEADATSEVVWSSLGLYENNEYKNVPFSVVAVEQGDELGVSVSVGYYARVVAQAYEYEIEAEQTAKGSPQSE